jgi:hypothetical protein
VIIIPDLLLFLQMQKKIMSHFHPLKMFDKDTVFSAKKDHIFSYSTFKFLSLKIQKRYLLEFPENSTPFTTAKLLKFEKLFGKG